ncbi:MAG: hypothetical protein WCH40_04785 [Verrucomicrobiales bacterium]
MDLVHPWLDSVEVRRMAERLLAPVQEQAVPVQDAGFGEQFVGYEPVHVPVPQPAAVVLPIAPPPHASVEPQSEVRGPFLDRIGRLRDWLHHHFQAVGVFLLDREGAVIFDESGHGKLHFLARSLAVASRRPGGMAGNVHVKVGAAATLEVIPVDTPYGCLVLGAVVPAPLDLAAITTVMDALRSVASPPH